MSVSKHSPNKKTISHEEQMRQNIKKEAFALMAQRGLDKVSMREIAQKLKVTKPVLYYYFKNKEDLCSSIIEEYREAFAQWLYRLWDSTHCLEEVMRQACQIQQRFYSEDPNRSRFAIQMLAYSLGLPAQSFVHRKSTSPYVVLHQLLQRKVAGTKWPMAAMDDMGMMLAALSADMMLNAYFHQHLGKWLDKPNSRHKYTTERLNRLVKIMMLGIKTYYKGKK